jgi:hypothetical protein
MILLQTILSSDSIVLTFVSGLLSVLILIAGYFIKRWIDTTEKRENATQTVLTSLNDTLCKVNVNLQVFEATMASTLEGIRSKADDNCNRIKFHETKINDHEIRLTIIEREKP